VKSYYFKENNLPIDLQNKPIGDWDVSRVTKMNSLFDFEHFLDDIDNDKNTFNEPLENWDVSNVVNMEYMFHGCEKFNQPLDKWGDKLSNVKNMSSMFFHCKNFNQPLNNWNVSGVENMSFMFLQCTNFNQPLNSWNVSGVKNTRLIFEDCPIQEKNKPPFVYIIDNNNIRLLLSAYTYHFDRLPNYLQKIPIGDWDVSRVTNMQGIFQNCKNFNQPINNWNVSNVTDMSDMFVNCEKFNQPLNKWNVSNVVNMEYMFLNCEKFNQPLNNWNVRNVTDMKYMFLNCEKFNQPLNNWNVRNVTDMKYMFNNCAKFNQRINNWDVRNVVENDDMFDGCNIQERNKPLFRIINVDARQIHTETGKINFENLNSFLKGILNNKRIPGYINYSKYIKKTISTLIHDGDESEEIKNEQREGLQRIMSERLNELNYQDQSPLIRESIFYVLEYVKKQSSIFKNMYVASFIKDCVHAYEGPDGMTCALGALERITLSLPPSCAAEGNDECEMLVGIILADPKKLIPEYIKDWYQLHKGGFPDKTEHEIEQNLIDYLKEKMPRNKFPEVNIEKLIKDKVDEIKQAIGFEPDAFTYGGKKRKTRKNRKTNIRKTTKKG
jgi:surface protein